MNQKFLRLCALTLVFGASEAMAKNLHLIDNNDSTGFSIYRLGTPDEDDLSELCQLGVEEIMVLSGDAEDHEIKHADRCPTLKVVYNEQQNDRVALTKDFINTFDQWVEKSKATGKKIAFRCNCGCHRTGRLAAYYQMKYQNITTEDAIAIMDKHGQLMWLHPHLNHQVQAMHDYIKGLPCSEDEKYCLKD